MRKVIINGETQYCEDGTVLSDVLVKSDNGVDHPCGGRGVCKKCIVTVNGKEELSCRYIINSDITVTIPKKDEILSETGAIQTGQVTDNRCLVLDIGTTTLALALVSLDKNEIIKVITGTNPQRMFGADVMTRIDYCTKNGVKELKAVLTDEINSMTARITDGKIPTLYVSGNVTMLHLFFGVDCSSMGMAPYTPAFLESKTVTGESLGLAGVRTVISLPSIAAFVGADLVAGLNFVGKPQKEKHNILIDLGTNAEIVLYDENSALCTAAAAGPCFEGANISYGMSATEGAIYSYSKEEIKTVGNTQAKGICATGLIDIIAELVCDETVDETGFMECESIEIVKDVYINQLDIRQYQLAKSAVYSAMLTLMKQKNVSFDDIETLYISGGFSAKINIENAVKTGLLPKELSGKCVAVNNSSLLGTVKYACEKNELSRWIDMASYVDLSADSVFSDLFIDNMIFE